MKKSISLLVILTVFTASVYAQTGTDFTTSSHLGITFGLRYVADLSDSEYPPAGIRHSEEYGFYLYRFFSNGSLGYFLRTTFMFPFWVEDKGSVPFSYSGAITNVAIGFGIRARFADRLTGLAGIGPLLHDDRITVDFDDGRRHNVFMGNFGIGIESLFVYDVSPILNIYLGIISGYTFLSHAHINNTFTEMESGWGIRHQLSAGFSLGIGMSF